MLQGTSADHGLAVIIASGCYPSPRRHSAWLLRVGAHHAWMLPPPRHASRASERVCAVWPVVAQ
jgi:hypothetical protein